MEFLTCYPLLRAARDSQHVLSRFEFLLDFCERLPKRRSESRASELILARSHHPLASQFYLLFSFVF